MLNSNHDIIGLIQTTITAISGIIGGYLIQHRRSLNEGRKGTTHQQVQGRRAVDEMVEAFETALKQKDMIFDETVKYKDSVIIALNKRLAKYEPLDDNK